MVIILADGSCLFMLWLPGTEAYKIKIQTVRIVYTSDLCIELINRNPAKCQKSSLGVIYGVSYS